MKAMGLRPLGIPTGQVTALRLCIALGGPRVVSSDVRELLVLLLEATLRCALHRFLEGPGVGCRDFMTVK